MNPDDVKAILLLYRPGQAKPDDPHIAEALALAQGDPGLKRWLEEQRVWHAMMRDKFRQIAAPAGLKEQIMSEHAARQQSIVRRKVVLAVAAVASALLLLGTFWFAHSRTGSTFAVYRSRMAGVALRGYAMDLATNDPALIRAYLAQNGAPADYVLPAALRRATLTGCAIERWGNAKVSMICFRSGRPLPPGIQSDLWLFVVDHAAVNNAPAAGRPELARVRQLMTATWTEDGKLYVLGTTGDEPTLRRFL